LLPTFGFWFHEEPPVEPSKQTPAEPPAEPAPAPKEPEPKTPEEVIAELKRTNRPAYDILYGRGVSKGKADAKPAKLSLDDEQVKAAEKLFKKCKAEDIDGLLQARADAEAAALEKAKADQNFADFSEQLKAQHAAAIENADKVHKAQIEVLQEQLSLVTEQADKLRRVLTDVKITQEVLTAAKAKGFIDPTDAVVQVAGQLTLNDDIEIVDKDSGNAANLAEMLSKLVADKPHLISASPQKPGKGSKPPVKPEDAPGSSDKPTFTRSQLRDTNFYKEHEAEIMEAARENRIVDDIGQA
jgi:hypothetical protein